MLCPGSLLYKHGWQPCASSRKIRCPHEAQMRCQVQCLSLPVSVVVNPGPAKLGYALPLQTV